VPPPLKPPRMTLDVVMNAAAADDVRVIIPVHTQNQPLAALRALPLHGPIDGRVHMEGYVGDGSARDIDGDVVVGGAHGATLFGMRVDGRTLHVRKHR